MTASTTPDTSDEETGTIVLGRCDACARWLHPLDPTCPACGSPGVPGRAPARASVYSFTVNHHAYRPDLPVPYTIALVELAAQPGLRFVTRLVDCRPDEVEIGSWVVPATHDPDQQFPLYALHR